ncbi:hypothetical protein FWH09_02665 [Candidatus Saccharibacteria bacterium]|nr:hypothetical protein [Candidatus Saccharibacteria bacterium]
MLDRAGTTELVANLFRITQTQDRLVVSPVDGKNKAGKVHKEVGETVRHAIEKIGGTMPEDLAPEKDIKLLKKEMEKKGQLHDSSKKIAD